MSKYVMAFDAGTTSGRSILFDKFGNIVAIASQEFPQIYPKPGWVEHNPLDIWSVQINTAKQVINETNAKKGEIAAIGITNQRETTVLWEKSTGKPIMNAIVWQDRRTADICDNLRKKGFEKYVKENMGIPIDAYFSGTKIKWILDNIPGAREKAESGEILFGTVDTWLIWKLSGGKIHVTDYSNASRTMLFNIKNLEWDEKLLTELDIPRSILPKVCMSSEIYGYTADHILSGFNIPIASAIGDQQGALFGQACFDKGMVKATYGTGGSLMMNTGEKPMESKNGLLTTIAWGLDGKVNYALEGLLYTVGSSVQWLRDELGIIKSADDSEYFANKVDHTNGVYVVPAFTGLSAPHWDQHARGGILGLTRGANQNHIIRATLESMAYQIRDVVDCMESDSNIKNVDIKVDGGACKNNFVMQFQSDIVGVPVLRPKIIETTARGAAFLAGLATGFWKNTSELLNSFELDRMFNPDISSEKREELYSGWKNAVEKVKENREYN